MGKHPPQFIEEIRQVFEDSKFKRRFECDTGYPVTIYKNDSELVTAFLLHRENIGFDYGKMYPEHGGERQCEVDFTLSKQRVFKLLPDCMNVVNWPSDRPVKYIENKRNVHNKYDPRPKEVIEEMLKKRKRGGSNHALLQREFLLSIDIETYPLGEDGLEWFYHNGLLADS